MWPCEVKWQPCRTVTDMSWKADQQATPSSDASFYGVMHHHGPSPTQWDHADNFLGFALLSRQKFWRNSRILFLFFIIILFSFVFDASSPLVDVTPPPPWTLPLPLWLVTLFLVTYLGFFLFVFFFLFLFFWGGQTFVLINYFSGKTDCLWYQILLAWQAVE